jgi:hypothetical protein
MMLWEFVKRVYGPHLLLIVAFTVASTVLRKSVSPDPPQAVVIGMIALSVLCWAMSDFFATGGRALNSETAPEHIGLVAVFGNAVPALCLAIEGHHKKDLHWLVMPLIVAAVDIVLLSVVVAACSAYATFVERSGDSVMRSQARREALRYYNRHAVFLAEEFPSSLFRAHLSSATGDHLPVGQVWAAVRELLGRLETHCQEGRRRFNERTLQRAQEQKRCKQIDKEIVQLEAKIEKLRKGTVIDDEEFAEREILACEHEIRELREQKDMLDTLA